MKLLTLNTHSLVEENYVQKLSDFVKAIADEKPHIIALQEVNQSCHKATVSQKDLLGFCPCGSKIKIRKDNHVYNIIKLLRKKNIEYYWTWLPIKKGYDKYDEGIALMSLSPISKTKVINISDVDDYNNWKTRKILGICIETSKDEWFFSVHFGWWDDKEEPFANQWKRTELHMSKYDIVWLMGDFNNPSEVRNEGYDLIKKSHWYDSYVMAEKKDEGITVQHIIDGWQDKISDTNGMRIDQIWCNKNVNIEMSNVIFNGVNYSVVSDHYGVIIESKRD